MDGDDGDAAVIADPTRSETISRILMVSENQLQAALMTAILTMRGEHITKKLNVDACTNARNATAKALYVRVTRGGDGCISFAQYLWMSHFSHSFQLDLVVPLN